MPERQSSPGEATASPEPEITEHARDTGGTEQTASGDAPDAARAPSPVRTAERAGSESTPAPTPAPRPTPRPAPAAPQPEGDESPTVRTPAGRAPTPRPGNGEHPNGHPGNGHAGNGQAGNGQANGQSANGQPVNGEAPTIRASAQRPSPAARPAEPHPLADPRPPAGARPPADPRPSPAPHPPADARPAAPRPQSERPPATPHPLADPRPSGPPHRPGESRPEQRSGEAATVVVPVAVPGAARSPADGEATQMLPRSPFAADDPVTERIERVPAMGPRPPMPPADAPTRVGLGGPGDIDDGGRGDRTDGGPRPGRGRRRVLVLSAVVGALGLLYGGDLLLSSGSMPRGVTVAGIGVGGMSLADAETQLRSEIGARTSGPIPVTVGDARGEIDPAAAGLSIDWEGTLGRAGSQPLNPITRITSFFSGREVGVVTSADPTALNGALEQLGPVVDREPVEGSVRFEGTQPQPVDPQPGQQLNVAAAVDVVQRDWANGGAVVLPITELPPTTTAEDVATAIQEVARPAVAAPITVIGENGVQGTVTPEVIAASLSFEAENGGLVPELNQQAIQDALASQMAASEKPGRDATFEFTGGRPTLVPSQDGRGVDYEATVKALVGVLSSPQPREVTAVYAEKPAEVTTEELRAVGNPEIIGEFTTGGFAPDSGLNIRRAAELVNGTVVGPGEVFSLDAVTGPRTAANGYVEAGVIDNGRASRGIAGGASQVSTTLYNASYFAGMTLLEHKAHSFYISRYPAGREATIATGAIDNKFRNDNKTPILIRTRWTPTSVTVQIYGQRQFEVTGEFGPRTNPTQPNEVTIPAGEDCHASNGSPGFTITDTRTRRNVDTGEVARETITTRYNPAPRVVCED
ncbi:VanW family protein [Pseudonocardia sp. DSM 110487]|uniref:VanW family protein n=1 Tax=Pseudonocardia sp. DSM 110487 TaxID=2865833 RepID=UPI001C69F5DB|nr:VanW family protein [Pseudonocardia sp. DSM 110487]QYN35709.1 VanW family protein [Pseudonocardia sp. DSM 110487]